MLMELMGLQLPGGSFVNPGTPLREKLTDEAVRCVLGITSLGDNYIPVGEIVDEKAIVNAIIGLLATGGSTNHTIHLAAIARAAGITINWDDFADLSAAIPLLARVYPNGVADVNHFHAAGGLGLVIRELLDAGLLHEDVTTILGHGMRNFAAEPFADNGGLEWRPVPDASLDDEIIASVAAPFDREGGLRLVKGNLGRAIVKISAVAEENRSIIAPARVFTSQQDFKRAFNDGELETDFVAVLANQGPAAIGMPELHKLTPYLGLLQNRGFKVALLTDGRMSGASGKVLAAIQATPEAASGGLIGKIRNGDLVTICSRTGTLDVAATDIEARDPGPNEISAHSEGVGRELFATFRERASSAEEGASFFTGTGS
jgi:phosphogluconate dehydratase